MFFGWLFLFSASYTVYGQETPVADTNALTIEKVLASGPEYDLIKPMVGDWQVEQRSWAKAGAKPVVQPLFTVRRRLTGHFLEEVMEAIPGTNVKPFTRVTYLNFNNANRQWEYIVLDSRYPVMMFETSVSDAVSNGNELTLYLPAFVMPPGWDEAATGKLAKQRRTIALEKNRNVVQQFWTLPAGKEFVAIEYTYERRGKN